MELKPCPRCKGRPGLEYNDDIFTRTRRFRFSCCGIVGDPSEHTSEAIKAWNRRVGEGEPT